MKGWIRFFRVWLTRAAMRLLWIFPVRKKQIFFSAYEGKQFACNPRAVFEALCADPAFGEYSFVWELNDPEKRRLISDARVSFVEHNSFAYFRAVLTSRVLLTNSGVTARLPLRKSQININTWHGGGAYKRVGYAVKSDLSSDLYELTVAGRQTTWFLSSSGIFTDVMTESVQLPPERFAPTGMPRNDVFFRPEKCRALREKVLAFYGLEPDCFLALYAPTYRGAVGEDRLDGLSFDVVRFRAALEAKFGKKAVVLLRMHYFHAGAVASEGALSASDYPDMQELLAAADLLMTDYSSSMWDFALTGKPCLLYAPDLGDYDTERGFYTNPETWPGLLCQTEAELLEKIAGYDEPTYREKIRTYLAECRSFDDGRATERVAALCREMA